MSPGQWTAVMHFPVWNETFFVRFDLNNIVRVEKKKAVILFRQMFNLFSLTLLIRSKYLKITYCLHLYLISSNLKSVVSL